MQLLKHKFNRSITSYIYNFLKPEQIHFTLQALKIFWKVFQVLNFSKRVKIENSEILELSSFPNKQKKSINLLIKNQIK